MSTPVIKVENLSKQYRIGEQVGYKTFRESIVNATRSPLNRLRKILFKRDNGNNHIHHALSSLQSPNGDTIWALKNISFEVKQGELVGIIGRNGAGKSTLLKLLSKITEPTTGRVELRGRVGSLLEVGTGFHPELTGHENIYLYGAILGMDRWEVTRKFDEIVAFAELEKFIDTPVKRYSSGMYMRLAFAVAAHLEPEILLVDEVLAVGDAAFQKKCIGKMGKVAKEGRTVLFVSHNMVTMRNICDDAIWLKEGQLHKRGSSFEVAELYLEEITGTSQNGDISALISQLPADPTFRLESLAVKQDGHPANQTQANGKPIEIELTYEMFESVSGFRIYFDFLDDNNDILIRSYIDDNVDAIEVTQKGRYHSTFFIPANFLAPRKYNLFFQATIHNVRNCTPQGIVFSLNVIHTSPINRAYVDEPFVAKFAPFLEWETKPVKRNYIER